MTRESKRFKVECSLPYPPFLEEAKIKWPKISNTEPTNEELTGLSYKLIVSSTDTIFDKFKEHLRVFEDSALDVTYSRLIIDPKSTNNIPTSVVYTVDITLVADKYQIKSGDSVIDEMNGQGKLNQEFTLLIIDLTEMLNTLGIII